MKQYIKTLALMLLVGFGLTSCLDDDRFDKESVNYPEGINFGAWASGYTEGNFEYHAVLTKNAAGDSIIYLHRIGKPESKYAGEVSRMFVASNVTYDKVAGMCSAEAAESAYGAETPAAVFVAYQRDQQQYTLQIEAKKRFVTTVAPTTKMYVDGYWEGGIKDEEGNYTAFLKAYLEPGEEENKGRGVAVFGDDLNDPEYVSYVFSDGTLTVASEDDEENVITASFNEDYQLVATDANGNSFVLDPQMSDVPAPEYSFDKPLVGDYTYNVLWSGETDPGLILTPDDVSDPDACQFSIANWCGGVNFAFEWNRTENICKVPMQAVGLTYDPYGDIYVCDYGTWGELTGQNIAFDSGYDAASATFNFHLIYFVFTSETTVGSFGHKVETFEITGEAPEEGEEGVRAKLPRKHINAGRTIDFSKKPTIVNLAK